MKSKLILRTKKNEFTHEFSGRDVEMLDYTIDNERNGQRYGGYLIVILDRRGEIIAYERPSENLYRNLDTRPAATQLSESLLGSNVVATD